MTDYYVATDGVEGNSGTIDSPWDIASAMTGHSGDVGAGDTLWFRGGEYYNADRSFYSYGWTISLQGSSGNPVRVRAYRNENPVIDPGFEGSNITPCQYMWLEGLEIRVKENLLYTRWSDIPGQTPTDLARPCGGLNFESGEEIKVINCYIHDCLEPLGIWGSVGGDTEVYGNCIWRNGWMASDRYHGHGFYFQNGSGDERTIEANVLLDNYSTPGKIFGTSPTAYLDDFTVRKNVFIAGEYTDDGVVRVGGGDQADNLTVTDNVFQGAYTYLGYQNGADNCVVTGNHHISGILDTTGCTNITRNTNTRWFLTYYWTDEEGTTTQPTDPLIVFEENAYDSNRGLLYIIGYDEQATADVDLSSWLTSGDTYEFLDPRSIWGAPRVSGTWTSGDITVPVDEYQHTHNEVTYTKYLGLYVVKKPSLGSLPTTIAV